MIYKKLNLEENFLEKGETDCYQMFFFSLNFFYITNILSWVVKSWHCAVNFKSQHTDQMTLPQKAFVNDVNT